VQRGEDDPVLEEERDMCSKCGCRDKKKKKSKKK